MTIKETFAQDASKVFFELMKENNKCDNPKTTREIAEIAATSEAPRFYVSYYQARRIISMMEKGKDTKIRSENKLNMYSEIYKRFREAKRSMRLVGYGYLAIILDRPAPSFFIDNETLLRNVYKSLSRKQ